MDVIGAEGELFVVTVEEDDGAEGELIKVGVS